MILLIGIVAGLVAVFFRSKFTHSRIHSPSLQGWWLVFLAFLPQFFTFSLSKTNFHFPDTWIPGVLISSMGLLLFFVLLNRNKPGWWLLGLGLCFNLAVISLNGGYMPISPETVQTLIPNAPQGYWQVGSRFGNSKDIILPVTDMHLSFFSDRFTLPAWVNYPVAFSIGDIFIAAGAFWFIWSMVEPIKN
jgi:hypothetical protein